MKIYVKESENMGTDARGILMEGLEEMRAMS
jgi:hypothetical protein